LGPYAFGWAASAYSTGTAFGLGGFLLLLALGLILILRTVSLAELGANAASNKL
jgi:hypothetical protein